MPNSDALHTKLQDKSAVVGIVGLGYVGLPLAISFLRKGFNVIGFDVDAKKIDALKKGVPYIGHLKAEETRRYTLSDAFTPTSDFSKAKEVDAMLICVPTPLTEHRDPDMRFIRSTAESLAPHLQRGQLFVLESTTYPGTTDELVRGILESKSGLKAGEDFYLAFSPEREDPGNKSFNTTTIPKVVGGFDQVSGDLAETLYTEAIEKVVRVSSSRVAEATKLTENIFRAINIALVNELKVIYDRMGIDVWEVLDACSTKPFGFMRFNPGPGWGGHCIPLDPFYLTWKAREFGLPTHFIELAGEVNIRTQRFVVEKLQHALNEQERSMKGSKVLVLGLAYKKNIDDPRESPAFEIIEQLLEQGVKVSYHDPFVPESPKMRNWPDLPPMSSQPLNKETLESVDAVLLITDHSDVDYDLVRKHAKVVVDTRGVYRGPVEGVVKA